MGMGRGGVLLAVNGEVGVVRGCVGDIVVIVGRWV